MPSSVFSLEHKELVQILAEARRLSGLTQTELSERLGRSQTYVSNIERGQRRIDVIEFYSICVTLERDPIEIFGKVAQRFEALKGKK